MLIVLELIEVALLALKQPSNLLVGFINFCANSINVNSRELYLVTAAFTSLLTRNLLDLVHSYGDLGRCLVLRNVLLDHLDGEADDAAAELKGLRLILFHVDLLSTRKNECAELGQVVFKHEGRWRILRLLLVLDQRVATRHRDVANAHLTLVTTSHLEYRHAGCLSFGTDQVDDSTGALLERQ